MFSCLEQKQKLNNIHRIYCWDGSEFKDTGWCFYENELIRWKEQTIVTVIGDDQRVYSAHDVGRQDYVKKKSNWKLELMSAKRVKLFQST